MTQTNLPLVTPNSAFALVRDALITYAECKCERPEINIPTFLDIEIAIWCEIEGLAYKQVRFTTSLEVVSETLSYTSRDFERVVFWSLRHDKEGTPKYLCGEPSQQLVDELVSMVVKHSRGPVRYHRLPQFDKRKARMQDIDLDAWYDTKTDQVVYSDPLTRP